MCENRILLKGGHASKVVDDVPDATMVFMDGQVKSHLLVLATNPFLHQLIKSSWVPGEISTILMPQHSVKDMLLEFSIPEEIVSVCMDEEMERQTSSPDKETEYAFGEIKVEEPEDEEEVYVDVTSDCQNAGPQNIDQQHPEHPPDNNGESDQLIIEPGEIFREDKFEETIVNCSFTVLEQ